MLVALMADGSGESWKAAARSLVDELATTPPARHVALIRERIGRMPEEFQEAAGHFVTAMLWSARCGGLPMPNTNSPERWEKITAIVCGVGFVLMLTVLAIFIPDPTVFQYNVFRVVLAIGAAGFATAIPGFIHVQVSNVVRAGGALAIFVIIYFWNPAQLVVGAG